MMKLRQSFVSRPAPTTSRSSGHALDGQKTKWNILRTLMQEPKKLTLALRTIRKKGSGQLRLITTPDNDLLPVSGVMQKGRDRAGGRV
jgi:hypothetical protein